MDQAGYSHLNVNVAIVQPCIWGEMTTIKQLELFILFLVAPIWLSVIFSHSWFLEVLTWCKFREVKSWFIRDFRCVEILTHYLINIPQWFRPIWLANLTDFVGGNFWQCAYFFGKSYREEKKCSRSENTQKNIRAVNDDLYLNISKIYFSKNI